MSAQSATRQVVVTHAAGIHARPSLAIFNTVRPFQSQVTIYNDRRAADAREILQVLSLGVPCGAEVTLSAEGPDAEEAVDALAKLFADNFGMHDE